MNDDILQHTVAAPVDKISRFGTSTISVLERNWQGRDQISRDIRLTTNLRRPFRYWLSHHWDQKRSHHRLRLGSHKEPWQLHLGNRPPLEVSRIFFVRGF